MQAVQQVEQEAAWEKRQAEQQAYLENYYSEAAYKIRWEAEQEATWVTVPAA